MFIDPTDEQTKNRYNLYRTYCVDWIPVMLRRTTNFSTIYPWNEKRYDEGSMGSPDPKHSIPGNEEALEVFDNAFE